MSMNYKLSLAQDERILNIHFISAVEQLIELGVIRSGHDKIRLDIKDGLDGAGNQMEIKGGYKGMITMGFVVLSVWDTSDPNPVSFYFKITN